MPFALPLTARPGGLGDRPGQQRAQTAELQGHRVPARRKWTKGPVL